jgi:hypothetical protein
LQLTAEQLTDTPDVMLQLYVQLQLQLTWYQARVSQLAQLILLQARQLAQLTAVQLNAEQLQLHWVPTPLPHRQLQF